MSDAMKKVQSGQKLRIPAQTYNAFIDAVADYRRRTSQFGQQAAPAAGRPGVILVSNNTGVDQDRFSVLGIDGVVITPSANLDAFQNDVVFQTKPPSLPVHGRLFVILQEPLAAYKFGRAVVTGVTPVQVDMVRENHRYARLTHGDSAKLTSDDDGPAELLYVQPTPGGFSPGVKWAVVRLGGTASCRDHWAKLTQTWGTDTTATTIQANPCEDAAGTNPDPATTLTLDILPPGRDWHHKYYSHRDWIVPVLAAGDVVRYLPYGEHKGTLVGAKWADNGPWTDDPNAKLVSWTHTDSDPPYASWNVWLKFDSAGRLIEAKDSGEV